MPSAISRAAAPVADDEAHVALAVEWLAAGSSVQNVGMADVPVFVFDEIDLVDVFADIGEAGENLEAVDVRSGAYPIAYDADGQVFQVVAHLDNAKLVPTGRTDPVDLARRLGLVYGPQELAHDPYRYAIEWTRQDDERAKAPPFWWPFRRRSSRSPGP